MGLNLMKFPGAMGILENLVWQESGVFEADARVMGNLKQWIGWIAKAMGVLGLP